MTLDEILDDFWASCPPERSLKHRLVTVRRARNLARYAGGRLLELDTAEIEAWLDDSQLNDKSRRQYIGELFDLFDWAQRQRLVATNPVQPMRRVVANWEAPTATAMPPPGEIPTLAEAIDLYVWDRTSRAEIAARSARAFHDRLRLLLRSVDPDMPVCLLDRRCVIAFQRSVADHSQGSRRSYLSAIKTFCAWCSAEGWLSDDPTARLAKIKEPDRVPRALPRSSVAKVLAACDGDLWDLAVVWLQVGLGLRCAEVAALTLADYDPEDRKILVNGKGKRERLLPVPKAVHEALERYLDDAGRQAGALFRPRRRTDFGWDRHLAPNAVANRIRYIVKKAGIKQHSYDGISAHAFRHTALSDVMDKCKNPRTVQRMAGHASLATTDRYLRKTSVDELREAMEGRDYSAPPQKNGDAVATIHTLPAPRRASATRQRRRADIVPLRPETNRVTSTMCPACGPVDVWASGVEVDLTGEPTARARCPRCAGMIEHVIDRETADSLRRDGAAVRAV